ncbi:Acriflavine resistance protein B [Serratia fonticola]|uniref:Acriflavine resistance protein B n=1 Tax=Serratia fonticola TaxID=47917 RepID=A0A4U9VH54_SERFO|nr:Acriflavine resistance protein B [Serratia fonticola]
MKKLTAARNQLLGMAAEHSDLLVGMRPNGLEDTPQFKPDHRSGEKHRRWAFPPERY